MKYTVYKIINKINNKIYIGAHKTLNLDDGYMGSGNIIKRAIKKYGIENFEKEILEVFNSSEEMFEMEARLVTKDFIKETTNYNLKEGGHGGFDHINIKGNPFWSSEYMQKISLIGLETRNKRLVELHQDKLWSIFFSEQCKKGKKKYFEGGGKGSFLGKTHTQEAKLKISKAASIRQSGSGNSQYGKPKTEEQILKMKETIRNKPVLQCPHCSKCSNNKGSMLRWHFDNCKDKKVIV